MERKQYISIAEESYDENGIKNITNKLIDMTILDKFIMRICSPIKENLEQSLNKSMNELKATFATSMETMRKENEALKQKVAALSNNLNIVLADYNTKKASLSSKYKHAIDFLYALNVKFENSVSTFGRAKQLEVLQSLVKYLYLPTKNLRPESPIDSEIGSKVNSLLVEIDKFNREYRTDLEEYLTSIKSKWDDCVIYPKEDTFNPLTMNAFNGSAYPNGTPVYVVELGYNFPNSNAEKCLPVVFKRDINPIN